MSLNETSDDHCDGVWRISQADKAFPAYESEWLCEIAAKATASKKEDGSQNDKERSNSTLRSSWMRPKVEPTETLVENPSYYTVFSSWMWPKVGPTEMVVDNPRDQSVEKVSRHATNIPKSDEKADAEADTAQAKAKTMAKAVAKAVTMPDAEANVTSRPKKKKKNKSFFTTTTPVQSAEHMRKWGTLCGRRHRSKTKQDNTGHKPLQQHVQQPLKLPRFISLSKQEAYKNTLRGDWFSAKSTSRCLEPPSSHWVGRELHPEKHQLESKTMAKEQENRKHETISFPFNLQDPRPRPSPSSPAPTISTKRDSNANAIQLQVKNNLNVDSEKKNETKETTSTVQTQESSATGLLSLLAGYGSSDDDSKSEEKEKDSIKPPATDFVVNGIDGEDSDDVSVEQQKVGERSAADDVRNQIRSNRISKILNMDWNMVRRELKKVDPESTYKFRKAAKRDKQAYQTALMKVEGIYEYFTNQYEPNGEAAFKAPMPTSFDIDNEVDILVQNSDENTVTMRMLLEELERNVGVSLEEPMKEKVRKRVKALINGEISPGQKLVETPEVTTNKRRKLSEKPTSCKKVKDETSTRKFTVCAEHIQEFQNCTQWAHGEGVGEPKFQPFMMVYDEMKQRTDLVKDDNYFYEKNGNHMPRLYFLSPKDNFDRKEFGSALESIASAMKNSNADSGDNWKCTDNVQEFFKLAYGDKKFKTQGSNKQKRKRGS